MSTKQVPLGELAWLNPEALPDTTPRNFQFRYVDLSSIQDGQIDQKSLPILAFSRSPSRARRLVDDGDVLFGTVRPERRLHALIDQYNGVPLIASTGFCVVRARPKLCHPAFLFHSLRSDSVARQAGTLVVGSGYPALTESDVAGLLVPDLPPTEQRRIAEILDSLDELVAAQKTVTRKQASVYAGLLRGALYRDGGIPRWPFRTVDACVERIDAGFSPDLEDTPAGVDEWGVLKVSAIKPGRFVANENKVLRVSSLVDPRLEVRHGDLLISRANTLDLVGVACVARNPRPRLLLCDKTLRLVPRADVALPDFLELALAQHEARVQIEASASGTSGSMKNISQDSVRRIALPLPPLPEQREITKLAVAYAGRVDGARIKVNKLQLLKEGLMEDLLTGRVRVQQSEELTG